MPNTTAQVRAVPFAETLRNMIELAREAVAARESSDDPEDREECILNLYQAQVAQAETLLAQLEAGQAQAPAADVAKTAAPGLLDTIEALCEAIRWQDSGGPEEKAYDRGQAMLHAFGRA